MSLNSSDLAFSESFRVCNAGNNRKLISCATAICIAVGNVSFELLKRKLIYNLIIEQPSFQLHLD